MGVVRRKEEQRIKMKKQMALVEELIKLEKVPTETPRTLAVVMWLTHLWSFGDALAGLQLDRLIASGQEPLRAMAKKYSGIQLRKVTKTVLLTVMDSLAKKYKTFKILTSHGNTVKQLEELKEKLQGLKKK